MPSFQEPWGEGGTSTSLSTMQRQLTAILCHKKVLYFYMSLYCGLTKVRHAGLSDPAKESAAILETHLPCKLLSLLSLVYQQDRRAPRVLVPGIWPYGHLLPPRPILQYCQSPNAIHLAGPGPTSPTAVC